MNPKGYVTLLELDDGTRLTEGAVIDQYVADLKPDAALLPRPGTLERYRAQEWLNFIATEIHKQFSPLFHSPPEEVRAKQHSLIGSRFDLINMLRWADFMKFELVKWPALNAFYQRVLERPAVKDALEAEKRR